MIIADPTNNLLAAKEIMYPKMMPDLSQEEIERIITQEQPPMEPQAPEMAPEAINPEMQDLGAQDTIAQDQLMMQQEQPYYG
jgi:hypothetical protein